MLAIPAETRSRTAAVYGVVRGGAMTAEVFLVNPRATRARSARLPLSLLSLAAVLEGRHPYRLFDGNVEPDLTRRLLSQLDSAPRAVLGVSVMPGPQVETAIEVSSAVRARRPDVPIVWGGYFPTLYPDAALAAPYVDYLVRGQGESTLLELLDRLADAGPPAGAADSADDPSALMGAAGLSFKVDAAHRHGPQRPFQPTHDFPPLPYERLGDLSPYLRPSFLGRRTGAYQIAVGCRYHCEFCGVVSMFDGTTRLGDAGRLRTELLAQRDRHGATAVQFFDHNFFDTEASSRPILEVLAELALPWWCYARADTLCGFSSATWELIRRSRLRMAYIGAEAASDAVLKRMRKGSRVEQTLEVARLCRDHDVVPELSFIVGGPEDPEGEMEATFAFIRRLKRIHPGCEVILYVYSPTPQRRRVVDEEGGVPLPVLQSYGPEGPALPSTPEEWTEQRWVDYVCHQDAPWLTPRLRRRIRDFATVLGCRFPTVQDHALSPRGRRLLSGLASWRYATRSYARPLELRLARRVLRLRAPERESI